MKRVMMRKSMKEVTMMTTIGKKLMSMTSKKPMNMTTSLYVEKVMMKMTSSMFT